MKNIKIMKAIAVLSVTLVCGFWGSVSVAQPVTCTGTSGVASGLECLKEVTSFKLKVYEFGLCTDYPTVADRSKCTELFKNTTGFDLAISKICISTFGRLCKPDRGNLHACVHNCGQIHASQVCARVCSCPEGYGWQHRKVLLFEWNC